MESPVSSLIPVARRRTSMHSPVATVAGPSSPRHTRGHRRTASSGDEAGFSNRGTRPSSRLSQSAQRLHNVTGASSEDAFSPRTAPRSVGASTPNGIDYDSDLDGIDELPVDAVDRLRAPTRSSLSKQRPAASASIGSADGNARRRSGVPVEALKPDNRERLGLSRIPRAAVTHAVSLHGRAGGRSPSPSGLGLEGPSAEVNHTPSDIVTSPTSVADSPTMPTSAGLPSRKLDSPVTITSRIPSGPHGKTSRMITELQTELAHAKAQADRAMREVLNQRREIGTLTRTSEDLRETKERMRAEAESQNNMIARKDRTISELLGRARNAESSVSQHLSDRKDIEAQLKEVEADARAKIAEAKAAQAKAESEYEALRDAVKSQRDTWRRDVDGFHTELQKLEAQMRKEREEAIAQCSELLEQLKAQRAEHANIRSLHDERTAAHRSAEEKVSSEVQELRAEEDRQERELKKVTELARTLIGELARLRRLAREPPRDDLDASIAQLAVDVSNTSITPSLLTPTLLSPALSTNGAATPPAANGIV